MQIHSISSLDKRKSADVLVIPFWKSKDKPIVACYPEELASFVKEPLDAKDFKGDLEEILFHYPKEGKERRVLLLGLGSSDKITQDAVRRSYAAAIKACHRKKSSTVNVLLPDISELFNDDLVRSSVEGMLLSNYFFTELKHDTIKDNAPVLVDKVHLITSEPKADKIVKKAKKIVASVNSARNIINRNADLVTPEYLAEYAKALSKEFPSIKTTVFDKKRIEKEKMALLLAVNHAAKVDPSFIISSYKGQPDKKECIVIVGKGITYDTGGLSLKATNMESMKCDMAGAAVALGCVQTAAALGLKRNIIAVVPAAENAIGSGSYKLGDVYSSYSGKTVEITNTDAEGRLVLADGISYAIKNLKPSCIIDIGTLTGGIVVALGDEIMGLVSNNKELVSIVEKASKLTGEMVWQMPLHLDYKKLLKSDVADIKNSNGRVAHPLQAALFLHEFVGDTPWIHLDIAGPAFLSKSVGYHPMYATGVGIRLLTEFFEQLPAKLNLSV